MDVEPIGKPLRGRSMRRWIAGWGALWLSAAMLLSGATPLRAATPTQYDIEAAYLFNFGKFLRLPDTPRRTSFDICILGRNDFGTLLDSLTANEQNNGLPERTVKVTNIAAARSCAILFLSSSEGDKIDGDLAELAGAPVLTVSDMPHFTEHGGMIGFVTRANHVRFAVALDPVNRAGLTLSSELLKVAWQVTGKPKGEVN